MAPPKAAMTTRPCQPKMIATMPSASEEAATAQFTSAFEASDRAVVLASDRRADAVALEALIATEPGHPLIPKLARGLLAHRVKGRWATTQENAFVLLALARYFRAYEGEVPDFVARAWLGQDYVGESAFRGRSADRSETRVPLAALPATGPVDLTLRLDAGWREKGDISWRATSWDLRRMATEDPMTGSMNRRAFFPLLESLFEHARRHGKPLTVLMADIDRFKAINDIYGHAAGDRVIQGFAAILRRGVRQNDIICRYGGEEFCIALPGADAQLAATIAERLRAMAAAELGGCIALGDAPVVTASFGIAQVTESVPQAPQLVDQADQALYRAKRSGRNQVVQFETEGAMAGERA